MVVVHIFRAAHGSAADAISTASRFPTPSFKGSPGWAAG
jgi:hypothetical protein